MEQVHLTKLTCKQDVALVFAAMAIIRANGRGDKPDIGDTVEYWANDNIIRVASDTNLKLMRDAAKGTVEYIDHESAGHFADWIKEAIVQKMNKMSKQEKLDMLKENIELIDELSGNGHGDEGIVIVSNIGENGTSVRQNICMHCVHKAIEGDSKAIKALLKPNILRVLLIHLLESGGFE